MFEVKEKVVNGRTVLALLGSLATADVPSLQGRLMHALQEVLETERTTGCPQAVLVLDMSGVDYIASAGVALLVKVAHQARKSGARLCLAHLARPVQETLAILRLNTNDLIFEIFPTVEAALKGGSP